MTPNEVGKIDGYLEAVSYLKDDGTGFLFCSINKGKDIADAVTECFPKSGETFVVSSVENWQREVVPVLKSWVLTRRRIMNDGDSDQLNERLYDGFIELLLDYLDNPITWFSVSHESVNGNPVSTTNEAIWDCFAVTTPSGCYILHCGWDS